MKRSPTWIIVTAALLLAACTDAGSLGRKKPTPFTDFDALTIAQSACLFDCDVFEIKIFSDGRVRHSGPSFEQTGGPDESRLDPNGLTHVAQALHQARLDEMRDRYEDAADGCEILSTDMPTLSVHVSRNRGYRNKSVVFYAGCLGPSVPTGRINALIEAIDRITGTRALLERRKQARQSEGGDGKS